MKTKTVHILGGIISILLVWLVADPFMVWMPPFFAMGCLIALSAGMLLWTGLVVFEGDGDERDSAHKMKADRNAYLAGMLILIVALVLQGLQHHVNPWIASALTIMVVTKIISRIYLERNN